MLVHQGGEDLAGEVRQGRLGALPSEVADPLHLQSLIGHEIAEANGPRPAPGSHEGEAQLVDGEPQVLYLVEGEAQPAGQPGRRHPGESEELRHGRNGEAHLVLLGHVVAPSCRSRRGW